MGSPGPLILEISSDEETGFGDTIRVGDCGAGGGFGDREDHNWLSELLTQVDKVKYDDSDDVVVLNEGFPERPKKPRLQSSKPAPKVVDSGDDDCVVLEGDPNKTVVVVNGSANNREDDDSDDVEIVGEKGEVACRDFPHARHLCAKFLFTSTPHELHCGQCHCYVCDSLAPCPHWGTGISSIDHCHASDKDEYWKAERKNKREGCKRGPCTGFPRTTQLPTITPAQPKSLLHNQVLRPVTIRPCSMPANPSTPNALNQGRGPRCIFPRYKPQSQLVLPSRNLASGNRSQNAGNISSQLCPRGFLKRTGLTRAARDYQHPYQLTGDPSLRRRQTPAHSNSFDCSNQNLNQKRNYYAHSQPQNHSLPLPVRGPVPYQPLMAPRPNLSGNTVNTMPFQMQVPRPSVGNFENMVPRSVITSNPNMGNSFESQSSQPLALNNPSSLLVPGQNDFRQESQSQSGSRSQGGLDTLLEEFGFDCDSSLSGENSLQISSGVSQVQSVAAVDNLQCQKVTEDARYNSVLGDNSVPVINNPDSLEFQFDNWMFENQPLPGAFEVPLSPCWNVFSPEPGSIDACTLFDV